MVRGPAGQLAECRAKALIIIIIIIIESDLRPLNIGPSYAWKQAACREHRRSTVDTAAPKRPKRGIKASPYSITERTVPELIPVLGSQPARDVSHKPGGRLPLLFTRPAVTLATLKRAATNFAAW